MNWTWYKKVCVLNFIFYKNKTISYLKIRFLINLNRWDIIRHQKVIDYINIYWWEGNERKGEYFKELKNKLDKLTNNNYCVCLDEQNQFAH